MMTGAPRLWAVSTLLGVLAVFGAHELRARLCPNCASHPYSQQVAPDGRVALRTSPKPSECAIAGADLSPVRSLTFYPDAARVEFELKSALQAASPGVGIAIDRWISIASFYGKQRLPERGELVEALPAVDGDAAARSAAQAAADPRVSAETALMLVLDPRDDIAVAATRAFVSSRPTQIPRLLSLMAYRVGGESPLRSRFIRTTAIAAGASPQQRASLLSIIRGGADDERALALLWARAELSPGRDLLDEATSAASSSSPEVRLLAARVMAQYGPIGAALVTSTEMELRAGTTSISGGLALLASVASRERVAAEALIRLMACDRKLHPLNREIGPRTLGWAALDASLSARDALAKFLVADEWDRESTSHAPVLVFLAIVMHSNRESTLVGSLETGDSFVRRLILGALLDREPATIVEAVDHLMGDADVGSTAASVLLRQGASARSRVSEALRECDMRCVHVLEALIGVSDVGPWVNELRLLALDSRSQCSAMASALLHRR